MTAPDPAPHREHPPAPPDPRDCEWIPVRVLKRDVLGRVEIVRSRSLLAVRRLACGNGWPLTAMVARFLLRREVAALARLAGVVGVPRILAVSLGCAELLRTYEAGEPLWAVDRLAEDFFDRLHDLVVQMHDRGVCHNDLHKENNILVGPAGEPSLVDFQLASVHAAASWLFCRRRTADLRYVEKHRRRYDTRGASDAGHDRPRRARHLLKWLYNLVARRLLRLRGGEPRRPRGGPWPERTTAR